MRIRTCLCIFVFGISISLKAQEKLNFAVDFAAQYNEVNQLFRLEFLPAFSVQKGSHALKIAPVIQYFTNEARNRPEEMRFTGVSAAYFYNCPSSSKYLDFFFVYEFKAHWFEDRWTGNVYDIDQGIYKEYGYESEEFFNTNTLGYGFRINFGKHIYLQQSISAGLRFSEIKGEPGFGPVPNQVEYDFRGYDNFGFHWNGSVSLGYRF